MARKTVRRRLEYLQTSSSLARHGRSTGHPHGFFTQHRASAWHIIHAGQPSLMAFLTMPQMSCPRASRQWSCDDPSPVHGSVLNNRKSFLRRLLVYSLLVSEDGLACHPRRVTDCLILGLGEAKSGLDHRTIREKHLRELPVACACFFLSRIGN